MDKRRRHLLKLGLAAGGGAVFAAGYATTVRRAAREVTQGSAGEPTRSAQFGNALQPELRIDGGGRLAVNPQQRLANGMCFGCWTLWGCACVSIITANGSCASAGIPTIRSLSSSRSPTPRRWRRPGALWRARRG
ncbi:hypothetical protein N4G58_03785 [Edwardsiella piscicida]|nr:hypothetical protein N4G58_03785 [Edwardsiella piscicida]